MATLAPPISPSSPPMRRRTKTCARRCERYCCTVATYFPLAFVYGLSTWAVWVEANLGFIPSEHAWSGYHTSFLGILLYILFNTCYTVAVFTDPGSPVDSPASKSSKHGYSHLPTSEPRTRIDPAITAVTVSSTGAPRFCKKCLSPKPDRAHHCSTCRRCVLKMDHHCPWLATCVGLHNYKPFVLFLIYVCFFCWLCIAVTAQWIWSEVLSDEQYLETLMPVNVVMLAVISGIIGLVLTGFTVWHISLAFRGITTIESLEQTRYLTPMRDAHQQQLLRHQDVSSDRDEAIEQESSDLPHLISNTLHKASENLLTIHANAVPGATRIEEGLESQPRSPAPQPQFQSTNQTPAQRSLASHHARESSLSRSRRLYSEYLDDMDHNNKSLPHAFDLGYRANLLHLFGPNPWLWCLPICNTTGDGWRWEVSKKWIRAREELARERHEEEERVGLRGGAGNEDEGFDSFQERRGRRRNQPYDEERGEEDMSLHTLHHYPNSTRNSITHTNHGSHQRRDFDRDHTTGEFDTFVVSASSSSSDSNSDVVDGYQGNHIVNDEEEGERAFGHDRGKSGLEGRREQDGGWKQW